MMRLKNIILLSVIICIGGIALFFVCKATYNSKVAELKKKGREAIEKALEQELKGRNIKGGSTFQFKSDLLKVDMPDSVYLQDENGRYKYRLDPMKSQMNITNDNNIRSLHSIAFLEKPINSDSLNIKWKNYLAQSGIYAESIVCVMVTDKSSIPNLLNKTKPEWCNIPHLIFTVYIGYACEIELLGYIYYSFWNMMGLTALCYLMICIICIYIIFKLSILIQKRITQILEKRIIEVPIIEVVQEASETSVHSYILHENIIFYAERLIIEAGGIEHKISPQVCRLLDLFLQHQENNYIVSDEVIKDYLWADKYDGTERIHKAVDRLRSTLKKIDPSITIERISNAFQLIL